MGIFAKDDIWVGGLKGDLDGSLSDIIDVKKQVFGVVCKEHLFDYTFDAIVGLAYPQMSNTLDIGTPLFDSMID